VFEEESFIFGLGYLRVLWEDLEHASNFDEKGLMYKSEGVIP